MRVAYARVSTDVQSLDLQVDALARFGYDRLFTDHGVSGVADHRPGLVSALSTVESGDSFVVWRLDRVARSMRELSDTVLGLDKRGVHFHSLCEHIDVSSPIGELILHILSAMAQFERALIVERTKSGMLAAKERGVQFGRPRSLDADRLIEAQTLIDQGVSVSDAAVLIGTSKSTLYRYLRSADALLPSG
ncbi:MAG: recombinase family protein [Pseudomonadota bacterium]